MPKARGSAIETRGNFISEWYGHRVYPAIVRDARALNDQKTSRCPFLSAATSEERSCVKPPTSSGVCTISSASNGPRQDWLVCPYRALDGSLMDAAARRIFRIAPDRSLVIAAAPALAKEAARKSLHQALRAGQAVLVYLQDKLGGEISVPSTPRSPELAFDITFAELRNTNSQISVARYGVLEVQTMDFHGSYKSAVNNLKDALRLHGRQFARVVRENPAWLSDRIEGPNIANVFKRTFYQIMLKFQIGNHGACAGTVLALPAAVWDSWQRHLGGPELRLADDGTYVLGIDGDSGKTEPSAWIIVFDVEAAGSPTPNSLRIDKIIATDAQSLAYQALTVVPAAAIAEGGSADRILLTINRRLRLWWPEIEA